MPPSKRDQLGGMLGQVAGDITPSPPPMRKGAGVAGMFGKPADSAASPPVTETAQPLVPPSESPPVPESARPPTAPAWTAKDRYSYRTYTALDRLLEGVAYEQDQPKGDVVSAALVEYLRRRGRLPAEAAALIADLTARGLVQGE